MSTFTNKHRLQEHRPCGCQIYWELADPKKPESETNKKVPHWPDGKRHFCFPCGADGYGSEGCGEQVVVIEVDIKRNGVPTGKKKEIMVLAFSKGIKEHMCSHVRALQQKAPRKPRNAPIHKWFKGAEANSNEGAPTYTHEMPEPVVIEEKPKEPHEKTLSELVAEGASVEETEEEAQEEQEEDQEPEPEVQKEQQRKKVRAFIREDQAEDLEERVARLEACSRKIFDTFRELANTVYG